jgi:hypothetical protein
MEKYKKRVGINGEIKERVGINGKIQKKSGNKWKNTKTNISFLTIEKLI